MLVLRCVLQTPVRDRPPSCGTGSINSREANVTVLGEAKFVCNTAERGGEER